MFLFLLISSALSATQEECLVQLSNLSLDSPCTILLISKSLGYSFVLLSFVLKLPQILKIIQNQSITGISLTSFYIETLAFSICAAYGLHRGMPISTYGEHVVITIQCLVQNILYWRFSDLNTGHKAKAAGFFFLFWVPVILGERLPLPFTLVLPEMFWAYVPFYIAGMNIVVKCSQIKTNYVGGSTGNLSFVTSFFNLYGTSLRIITTLTELNDLAWLSMYLVGFTLNVIIVSQFWRYWDVKKKVE